MSKKEKKAIQLLKSYAGMTHKLTDNQGRPKLDQAIETALNYIEQLEKENKELKEDNDKTIKEGREAILYYTKDSIPKSVIREKIEELEQEFEEIRENEFLNCSNVNTIKTELLKELLGEEKC